MMRLYCLLVLLLAAPFSVQAQAQAQAPENRIDMSRYDVSKIMRRIPEATLKRLRKFPDRFIEEMASLIYGYGGGLGIDLAGIDRFIAMDRADVRAREVRRLMVGDLDNDLVVSLVEIKALMGAKRAGMRGRLLLKFKAADRNHDNAASAAEIRDFAQMRAMERVSHDDEKRLYGLMGFDLDENGWVEMEEIILMMEALRLKTVESDA